MLQKKKFQDRNHWVDKGWALSLVFSLLFFGGGVVLLFVGFMTNANLSILLGLFLLEVGAIKFYWRCLRNNIITGSVSGTSMRLESFAGKVFAKVWNFLLIAILFVGNIVLIRATFVYIVTGKLKW